MTTTKPSAARLYRKLVWALVLGVALTVVVGWVSALFAAWDPKSGRNTYVVADGRDWQLSEYRAIGGRTVSWQSMSGLSPMPGPGGRPMTVEMMEQNAAERRRMSRCTLDPGEKLGRPREGERIVHRAVEVRGWPLGSFACVVTQDESRMAEWGKAVAAEVAASSPPRAAAPTANASGWTNAGDTGQAGAQPAAASGWAPLQNVIVNTPLPVLVSGGFVSPVQTRAQSQLADTTIIPWRPVFPGVAVDSLVFAVVVFVAIGGVRAVRRAVRIRKGLCAECGYDLLGKYEAGCSECGWNRAMRDAASGQGAASGV